MIPRGAATVHKALAATDTIVEAADEGDVGDEDLELPEELVAKISASTAGDKGFYAVPPRGLPPPHIPSPLKLKGTKCPTNGNHQYILLYTPCSLSNPAKKLPKPNSNS
ncbi:coatomer [Culex quinquefasciatus]|uniref:Coatomer n=1 Tax=Culex quinquefasciatus TaxID=7176 RepID=B0X6M2_CULQU|nr:coatomer [Culex quinquefasciatus]|eukprot:XP_001865294.1 coatomer [Culex quinquefasciatus]